MGGISCLQLTNKEKHRLTCCQTWYQDIRQLPIDTETTRYTSLEEDFESHFKLPSPFNQLRILTFPMVDTVWNTQTLFREPGTKNTNSRTFWRISLVSASWEGLRHEQIFVEVLNESRKAIDCQAMSGARTSNLVCCFWDCAPSLRIELPLQPF